MELFPAPEPAPRGRLLVISPHLDDAVFGCGRLIAAADEALVVTVFAGRPRPGVPLTEWDRAAGFRRGDDVVGRRRDEDRRALGVLGARALWLDYRDDQYGGRARPAEIAARLDLLLARSRPRAVFFPLGLFHADHRRAREAALLVRPAHGACRWFAYEDALYRAIAGLRRAAIGHLRGVGLAVQPVAFVEPARAAARKRRAVDCYRSQLAALATPGRPGHRDLERGEGYWRVAAPAAQGL